MWTAWWTAWLLKFWRKVTKIAKIRTLELGVWGKCRRYIDERILTVFSIAFSLLTIRPYVWLTRSLHICLILCLILCLQLSYWQVTSSWAFHARWAFPPVSWSNSSLLGWSLFNLELSLSLPCRPDNRSNQCKRLNLIAYTKAYMTGLRCTVWTKEV